MLPAPSRSIASSSNACNARKTPLPDSDPSRTFRTFSYHLLVPAADL